MGFLDTDTKGVEDVDIVDLENKPAHSIDLPLSGVCTSE